jgi:GNAT superfamily N-acetyltransferase
MNLVDVMELQAGGPGSGCNPNAGRCGKLAVKQLDKGSWRLTHNEQAALTLSELDRNTAMTGATYVQPSYRGQGRGTALYKAAKRFAKEKGYKVLRSAETLSPGAKRIWEKMGGEKVGSHYELSL